MKRLIILFLMVFLLFNLTASLKVTEIELNPEGRDSGNEWIEFYSEKEVNLSEYTIKNNDKNNDGDKIKINERVEGYYVYVFEKQWLDNSDEKVLLYKNNKSLQETDLVEDSKNNNKTWQLCEGEWIFKEQTKNKQNCKNNKSNTDEKNNQTQEKNNSGNTEKNSEQETEPETNKEDIEKEENSKESFKYKKLEVNSNNKKPEKNKNITLETIKLNPKSIKNKENNKDLTDNIALIGLFCFFIVLMFLFGIKKIRQRKDEFR